MMTVAEHRPCCATRSRNLDHARLRNDSSCGTRAGDFALTEGQMTRSAAAVAGPWRYERLDGPGHWMQLQAPDAVNRLLVDFLPA